MGPFRKLSLTPTFTGDFILNSASKGFTFPICNRSLWETSPFSKTSRLIGFSRTRQHSMNSTLTIVRFYSKWDYRTSNTTLTIAQYRYPKWNGKLASTGGARTGTIIIHAGGMNILPHLKQVFHISVALQLVTMKHGIQRTMSCLLRKNWTLGRHWCVTGTWSLIAVQVLLSFLTQGEGGEDREDWPQCDDEDREGLKALLRKINQQVDCGDFDVGHYEVSDLVEFSINEDLTHSWIRSIPIESVLLPSHCISTP